MKEIIGLILITLLMPLDLIVWLINTLLGIKAINRLSDKVYDKFLHT